MPVGRTFTVQHVHLGPTGDIKTATFESLGGTVTSGSGPWIGQLGQVFEQDGKFYRLVKTDVDNDVDYIDGGVAYWHDKANYIITADASEGEALANGVAGGTHFARDVSAEGAEFYCFIQCGGDQEAVKSDGTVAVGSQLSGHASTDNQLVDTAAGTASVNKIVGIAISTAGSRTSDSGATVTNAIKVRWETGALI